MFGAECALECELFPSEAAWRKGQQIILELRNLGDVRVKGLQTAKTGDFHLLSTGRHPTAFAVTPLDGSSALNISPLCLHFRITHCPEGTIEHFLVRS